MQLAEIRLSSHRTQDRTAAPIRLTSKVSNRGFSQQVAARRAGPLRANTTKQIGIATEAFTLPGRVTQKTQTKSHLMSVRFSQQFRKNVLGMDNHHVR
jgi:hypothetical protein